MSNLLRLVVVVLVLDSASAVRAGSDHAAVARSSVEQSGISKGICSMPVAKPKLGGLAIVGNGSAIVALDDGSWAMFADGE